MYPYIVDHVIYDKLLFWKVFWLIKLDFDPRDQNSPDSDIWIEKYLKTGKSKKVFNCYSYKENMQEGVKADFMPHPVKKCVAIRLYNKIH